MVNVNEYKILVQNTLQGQAYNLSSFEPYSSRTSDNVTFTYVLPIALTPRSKPSKGGTSIPLDKPVNNKIFDLGGKTEGGSIEFEAFERFNPDGTDNVYNDRSYDPANNTHTLNDLIVGLENSTVSGSDAEALKLKQFFQTDVNGTYVVRSVREQNRWLRDYVDNPGLSANWRLFGGSYDWRTLTETDGNAGTPVFLQNGTIEEDGQNKGRGIGQINFNVGDRL